MVSGPRQSGKTTLLRNYLTTTRGSYRTLDRPDTRDAARDDPAAFVEYGETPRVIDEVQLGGDVLVRAIKMAVDSDPRSGQFILSGSSQFLTIPTLSESLAGRLAFVELWPLSVVERTHGSARFLPTLFDDPARLVAGSSWTRRQYLELIVEGGFPEVLGIGSPIARRAWYDGYLSTVINRDIRDFATITQGDAFPRLLRLVAARVGGLAVLTDLAQSVELARDTVRNYLAHLEMVYLVTRLPAWSGNLTSRLTKAAKVYPTDSGLAAHLLGVDQLTLAEPGHSYLGPLVETFAATELMKARSYHDDRVDLFHFRTSDKREVDFILEDHRGRIVAVEIKASTSPRADAFHTLRWLARQLGTRFHAGILFHLGGEASSRGDRIYSLPLSALWNHEPLPE